MEKGFFIRAEDAPNAHRAGHNKRLGVTCVERRKEERPIRIPKGADRKKREGFSELKNVSAKEPEKTEMDALQEELNKQGKLGWELVNVVHAFPTMSSPTLIFKKEQ